MCDHSQKKKGVRGLHLGSSVIFCGVGRAVLSRECSTSACRRSRVGGAFQREWKLYRIVLLSGLVSQKRGSRISGQSAHRMRRQDLYHPSQSLHSIGVPEATCLRGDIRLSYGDCPGKCHKTSSSTNSLRCGNISLDLSAMSFWGIALRRAPNRKTKTNTEKGPIEPPTSFLDSYPQFFVVNTV